MKHSNRVVAEGVARSYGRWYKREITRVVQAHVDPREPGTDSEKADAVVRAITMTTLGCVVGEMERCGCPKAYIIKLIEGHEP
jgi:hypothetical protein